MTERSFTTPTLVPVPAGLMLAFTTEALEACGLPRRDAEIVAGAMIEADVTGVDTHGIARLPQYVPTLQKGAINVRANVRLAHQGGAIAVVDGDNGMGHLVMTFAAETAVTMARECGIAWVGSRRSNHAGAGGIYAAKIMEAGLIGIYGAASSANHMAPWGGAEPLLGTNPIAVAIPAGEEPPVVLDVATSVSSFGVIRTHAMEGRPLPEGWVIDRQEGKPITDAARAHEGVLVPIGEHKGSGLATIIGLLAGPLNGAGFGRDYPDFRGARPGESNTGQFIIALDPARFGAVDIFKREIDRHIRDLSASTPLPGVDRVRVPGGARQQRRAERMRDGVPLSAALLKQLDDVAARLKLTPLRARTDAATAGIQPG
jgi:LDH2 family malate/lactate/ureidoglycolate dehydrogenase